MMLSLMVLLDYIYFPPTDKVKHFCLDNFADHAIDNGNIKGGFNVVELRNWFVRGAKFSPTFLFKGPRFATARPDLV